MKALYEIGPDGQVFDIESYTDGFTIACYPVSKKKEQIRPLKIFVPFHSPTKLNDIFTKLKFLGGRRR